MQPPRKFKKRFFTSLGVALFVLVSQVLLTVITFRSSCQDDAASVAGQPPPTLSVPLSKALNAFAVSTQDSSFGGVHARSFQPWNGKIPCLPPDENWQLPATQWIPATEGFFFLKEMKVGGSTAVGVHLRIAQKEARRQGLAPQHLLCKVRNGHVAASALNFSHRNRERSFLWTILRDPTKRAVSQFFHFEVSRKKIEPTDREFLRWIQEYTFLHRYYLKTLSMEDILETSTRPDFNPVAVANAIMNDYDFIGITERMEESVVALQLLLGLETGDILYLNAKGSGGFDDGAHRDQGCVYIVPGFISPGMKAYFESLEWKILTATDSFLHQAANRSLDLTIDRLGRQRFEDALERFRHALAFAEKKCRTNATFPCDPSGNKVPMKKRDCLWYDSGCGTPCLDQVAVELNLYNNPH